MTTPHIGDQNEVPGSLSPGYGSWGDVSQKAQEDWEAEQNAMWQTAAAGPLGAFGTFIKNLPTLVVVQMLTMLGDLLSNVPIVGETMEDIVDNIAAGLNQTTATANTANQKATEALGAYEALENELIQSGAVVSDHENRITVLESGNVVAEFFSNDVWTKPQINLDPDPPGNYHRHEFIGIGGGGGGRQPALQTGSNRQDTFGGGQGGFGAQSHLNANVGATVNVVIGNPGPGGSANGDSGSPGTATSFTDTGGSLYAAGGGGGGTASATGARGSGTTYTDWNASGGRGFRITGPFSDAPPTAGNAGYLANGGSPGTNEGVVGGNGGNCPAGRIGPGGGG